MIYKCGYTYLERSLFFINQLKNNEDVQSIFIRFCIFKNIKENRINFIIKVIILTI